MSERICAKHHPPRREIACPVGERDDDARRRTTGRPAVGIPSTPGGGRTRETMKPKTKTKKKRKTPTKTRSRNGARSRHALDHDAPRAVGGHVWQVPAREASVDRRGLADGARRRAERAADEHVLDERACEDRGSRIDRSIEDDVSSFRGVRRTGDVSSPRRRVTAARGRAPARRYSARTHRAGSRRATTAQACPPRRSSV